MSRVVLFLLICLCIPAEIYSDGYIELLVNRMLLESIRPTSHMKTTFLYVDFYYGEGDIVNFWCAKGYISCAHSLTYEPRENGVGSNGSTIFATGTDAETSVLGADTTLRGTHNGSRATCECSSGADQLVITVTFIVTSWDGILNVKMNNLNLRYQQPAFAHAENDYNLWHFDEEYAPNIFECETNVTDIELQTRTSNGSQYITTNNKIEITPNLDVKFVRCVARRNKVILRNVVMKIRFRTIDNSKEYIPLTVDIHNRSTLLEMYEIRPNERILYYTYEDGESILLNCSTAASLLRTRNYKLVFGNTVQKLQNIIVTRLTLSVSDHKSTLNCSLVNSIHNYVIKNVRVLFLMKDIDKYRARTTYLVAGIIGGVAAVVGVVVVIVAVFYWRNKRNRTSAARLEPMRASVERPPSYHYVVADQEYCEILQEHSSLEPKASPMYDYTYGQNPNISSAVHPSPVPEDSSKTYGCLADHESTTSPPIKTPDGDKQQCEEDPAIQNTLYYWLSSASSSSSLSS